MDWRAAAGYIGQRMNFELKAHWGLGPAPRWRGRTGGAWRRAAPVLAVLAVLALPVFVLSAMSPAAVAQQGLHGAEDVAASRDRVLGDGRYQTEKPAPQEVPDVEPWVIPPWLVKTILWALGAVVAGLVIFFLVGLARDLVQGRRGRGQAAEAPPAETPGVTAVPPQRHEAEQRSLDEADALAAAGRFSEAIHLLLLVALERLRQELGPRVAPAMTGREVLRLAAIPGTASAPLQRMVALSEINHFGGRSAAEPDYRRCREDFLRFNGLEGAPA